MQTRLMTVMTALVLAVTNPPTETVLAQEAKEITNSIGMKLVLIPKGTFKMGSPPSEEGSKDDERQHEVTISQDYYLGAFEVTQAQYRKVMGNNPSIFQGDRVVERDPQTGRVVKELDSSNHPVEQVSWEDAVEFCKRLSELPEEKKAGRVYRLPTEAEWEYACRAGSKTAYSFGDNPEYLKDYAWFDENSGQISHAVGEKKPNAWGLYDMHGNVFEWCSDWYGEYPKSAVTDFVGPPVEPREGSCRVCRGADFRASAAFSRSAYRVRDYPRDSSGAKDYPLESFGFIGFRIALSPSGILNSIGMNLVLIPKGTFKMGSLPSEEGSEDNERQYEVTISQDYYLGTLEVTQAQYQKVMGTNPSNFQGDRIAERHSKTGRVVKELDSSNHPVEQVSWEEAVEFCKRLSELPEEKKAGRVYRLPTEAEWEYACRAGSKTAYSFGDNPESLEDYASFKRGFSRLTQKTSVVGKKKPNAWGLYDMHGNVWEWCSDLYGEYPEGAVTDPMGPSEGSFRVYRGGSWEAAAASSRSAYRLRNNPFRRNFSLGFRVALSPSGIPKTSQVLAVTNPPTEKVLPQENKEITNSIGMKLVLIPKGTFKMGLLPNEEGYDDIQRRHEVTLSQDYYLGVTEVTQGQYKKVMGTNPSRFQGDRVAEYEHNRQTGQRKLVKEVDSSNHPVEQVSWEDAVEFCKRLSELPEEKKAGRVYRLPTEAEWEYACRAGSQTAYSFGDNPEYLKDYAWFDEYINGKSHAVGEKKPNAWGLYDMHGNVFEWCSDWYGEYPKGAVTDPVGPKEGPKWPWPKGYTDEETDSLGPKEGPFRVYRGGSWAHRAESCWSKYRLLDRLPFDRKSDIGFRVALSPSGIEESKIALQSDSAPHNVPKMQESESEVPPVVRDQSEKNITNSIGMKLVLIPKGSFQSGRDPETGGLQREVTISKDYYLGIHEVTQSQYKSVMGSNPSYFQGDKVAERHPQTGRVLAVKDVDTSNHPVEQVSWKDAVEFCRKLSALPEEKKAGRVYRLPTEAEWEYGCRAGTQKAYSFGDGNLGDYAWFHENSGQKSHPVGEKKPNPWGLYDMHGNVWEFCSDWFDVDLDELPVTDPTGPSVGSSRNVRGGSWAPFEGGCRTTSRLLTNHAIRAEFIGFRVALSAPEIPK